MSSLILPLMETNRSSTALTFLVFLLWTLVLAIIAFPDFSSITVTLGLLIITVISTAVLSSLGLITWMKNRLNGLRVRNNQWIGNDHHRLRDFSAYHRLLDRQASNLFFGFGLIVLCIMIAIFGNDLIVSVFGETYLVENVTFQIFQWIATIVGILGFIIIYNTIKSKKRRENERLCFDMIVLSRIRNILREPDAVKKIVEQLLDTSTPLLTTNEFFMLHDELEALIYKSVQTQLVEYYRKLKDIHQSYIDYSRIFGDLGGWGYPKLNINIDLIVQSLDMGRNYLEDINNINLDIPKYLQQILIMDFLFGKTTQIYLNIKDIQEHMRRLRVLDRLLFRYSWFFVNIQAVQGYEFSSLLHSGYKLDRPIEDTNRMDSRDNVKYGILFSSFLYNLILVSHHKVTLPSVIQIDLHYNRSFFEEHDITMVIEDPSILDERLQTNLLEDTQKHSLKPKQGSNDTLSTLINQDIEFFKSAIREKRDWISNIGLPFESIFATLEQKPLIQLINLLHDLRTEVLENLTLSIDTVKEDLSNHLQKTPWLNHMIWDDREFKFKLAKGRINEIKQYFTQRMEKLITKIRR